MERVALQSAEGWGETAIRNLWHLYMHEFSLSMPKPLCPNAVGRFSEGQLDRYFVSNPLYRPQLIYAGEFLAGFILCQHEDVSHASGVRDVEYLNHLFVLPFFRRAGVGAQAARSALLEQPGNWELFVHSWNTGAQAFWRLIMMEFDGWTETPKDGDWDGALYSFEVKEKPPGSR